MDLTYVKDIIKIGIGLNTKIGTIEKFIVSGGDIGGNFPQFLRWKLILIQKYKVTEVEIGVTEI